MNKPNEKPHRFWVGSPPTECDICGVRILDEFVDGKTRLGPWAHMCLDCFEITGHGLGTGAGQRYQRRGDRFAKVEG